jgi:hypothetical protein
LQHAVECEYINTVVNGRQLTVYHTPGVSCELPYQCIAASNGKPPWSTKAFLCTVCESEHDVVVSSRILVDEFPNEHPQESTKKDLITLEEATAPYMVKVIAASRCLKQQLISCRYSTCLQQWQGKEVMYGWNSLTCAWHCTWPKWPKEDVWAPQERKRKM